MEKGNFGLFSYSMSMVDNSEYWSSNSEDSSNSDNDEGFRNYVPGGYHPVKVGTLV